MASLLNIGRGLIHKTPSGLPAGAVDMGLPSGTLWAQGNIIKDANGNYAIGEPTDYGCYFSWGNIDGHNAGDGYSFNDANYNASPGNSLTASIDSNDAEHDAAVARIGGVWYMPTENNFKELFNNSYTTRQWTTIGGVSGYKIISKINNNWIFLTAGGMIYNTQWNDRNTTGIYWSSTMWDNNKKGSYLYFRNDQAYPSGTVFGRSYGFSIRPVYTPNN